MISFKKSIVVVSFLLNVVSFSSNSQEVLLSGSIDSVLKVSDEGGRRLCHEIFKYGSMLKFSSGEYAVDDDGVGENSPFLASCDSLTGKTMLLSMKGKGDYVSAFTSISEGSASSLKELFSIDGNMELTEYSSSEDEERMIFANENVLHDAAVILRLPVETMEIEIRGLKHGKVSLYVKRLESLVEVYTSSLRTEDKYFITDLSSDFYYLRIQSEKGLVDFEEVWVR